MGVTPPSGPRNFVRVFAALSLACVCVGCWVAAANGVPAGVWARNLGAWAVGVAMAALVGAARGKAQVGFLLAAPLGVVTTFLGPGLSGVHRWALLGPVRINMAEVLLPAAVVALAALSPGRVSTWLVAAAVTVLLVVQPDASQATAFGGAVIVTLLLSHLGRAARWGGVAATVVGIAGSWLRPDPLAPVPEVEGIFGLAWTLSPLVAVLASVALAATALSPILAARDGAATSRKASLALAVYFLLSAIAPALGAFPVPLVGMGMSPILGSWLGAGLLAALARGLRTPSPSP